MVISVIYLLIILPIQARFNYNSDLLNWFGTIISLFCPGGHVQMIGLDPHTCVSVQSLCKNIVGVQQVVWNTGIQNILILCHERFQNLGTIGTFGLWVWDFVLAIDNYQTLSMDFTNDQITYYTTRNLNANLCVLGFKWINSQNVTMTDCLFCNFFNYGKNCQLIAEGAEADTSQRTTAQSLAQCTKSFCKFCKLSKLNSCVAYKCQDFYYGADCSQTCQLTCTSDTCICDPQTGTYLSCKPGLVEQINDNQEITCVQKCDNNCNQCVLSVEGEYVCTSCKYLQTYGQLEFTEMIIVNRQCQGIANCLEYYQSNFSSYSHFIGQLNYSFVKIIFFKALPYTSLTKTLQDQKALPAFIVFLAFIQTVNKNNAYVKHFIYVKLECKTQITNCVFCKYSPPKCIGCRRQYYLDNNKCLKSVKTCYAPCGTCLAYNSRYCTTCDHDYLKVVLGKCFCADNYYDSGVPATPCSICHSSCATCKKGDLSSCTSCDSSQNNFLLNGQCVCNQGYGKISETNFQCQFCHIQCKTCQFSNNPSSCTSCWQEQNREINQNLECACKEGFNDDQGALSTCYQCHFKCGSCYGPSENNCLSCSDQQNRSLSLDNRCICNKNYIESSVEQAQCLSCNNSCSDCLNDQNDYSCTECPNTRIPDSNNQTFKCICKDKNYFDDGISQECQQCHYSCMTCNGENNNNCLSCDLDYRVLNDISCDCPAHYYENGSVICNQCHYSCLNCLDNQIQSCLECSFDDDFRLLSEGYCLCQQGYFDDGQQSVCQQCSYKCKTCKDYLNTCLECEINTLREIGEDFSCSCPSHSIDVPNEPICQLCNFKCAYCYGVNENNCTKCDNLNNRELRDSQCFCKKHYFEVGLQNCQICSQYCYECENDYDNCTSCRSDRFLVGNKCYCGTKLDGLNVSTIDSNGEANCLNCHYSCLTCDKLQLNICLTCLSSEKRQILGSKCLCEDGYVDIGLPQCQKCSYNCQNCIQQQSFCTSCQPNCKRILDPTTKSCLCQNGYFDDGSNAVCQQCHYTCEQCFQQATKCLTCPLNQNRNYNVVLFKCDCNTFYYDDGQVNCNKCHYSCQNCNGNKDINCTECSSPIKTFRYLNNNRCQCLDGYYDSGVEICEQCAIQCLTCSVNSFQCQSCVITRQLQQNDCICKEGYFDNNSKDCQKCDDNCLDCKRSSKNCTSCNILRFRVLNVQTSRCDCMEGYLEINNICQKCSSSCLTCVTFQDQCQTCPLNRYKQGNTCLCNLGYYDDGNDCQQCHKSCETCFQSYDFCLTCSKQDKRQLKINQCICQEGYYENLINTYCEKCSENCLTCISTPAFCLTCHPFEMIDQVTNTCICSKGYYFDGVSRKCLQCHYSCLICESYAKCTECQTQTRYLNTKNECNCQLGYFEVNQPQCNKCQYYCETCTGESFKCQTCNSTHKRELDQSFCKCLIGYYDVGIEICQACSTTCKSCILSSTSCLSCFTEQFRTLKGNNCICKDGYFDDGSKICKECSKSCKTCIQSAIHCNSCDARLKRFDQSKIFQCPCIQGYYEDSNEVCQKCNVKCETCLNQKDSCISCSQTINSYRLSISQNCICKNGYYDDGINVICKKCDSKCKTCLDQSIQCVECFNNLRSNPPECQCIEGYFEAENQVCLCNFSYILECENQCQSCIQYKSQCLSCKIGRVGRDCKCQDGFYEAGLELCQPCYNQCKSCQLADFCLTCKGDRVNFPYCYCQEGYYDDNLNEYCQACDSTCKSCVISGCTTCNGNRILSSEMTCDPPIGSISYATTPWCSDCQVAVIKATFSDDLSQIEIKFDFPLKFFPKNNFNNDLCSLTLKQSTLEKIGQNYDCQISESDQSIFIISLDYAAEIEIGDSVEFNKNILSHVNCQNKLEVFIFSIVKLSQNSLPPKVQFNLPNYDLSPCLENLILYNLTENDGKRQLINLNWNYTIEPDERNTKLDQLVEDLTKNQLLNVLIPAETLPEVKRIFFFLSVTNLANITSNVTFYIKTKTISEPEIQLSSKEKYYAYEKIELQFLLSTFSKCQLPKNDDKVHFSITLTEIERNNSHAKHSNLPQSVEVFSNQYQFLILEYSLSPDTKYTFQIQIIDKNTNQNATKQFYILIGEADLFCQFSYYPKIQDVGQDLNLNILCKDLNEDQDWNSDPEIQVFFQCQDLVKSKECKDKRNKTIEIIPNSFSQSVKRFSLEPYSIQQWIATATKFKKIKSISTTIVYLQESTSTQKVIYNQWYQMRPLGNYELLNFTFDIPVALRANLSSLSIGLVYDFQLVTILSPTFFENQLRIYDNFHEFQKDRKISIYFQAQYTHSITPSQTSLTFEVSEPPSCGKLRFSSTNMNQQTYLKIGVTCQVTQFPPIKYKFNYFLLKSDLEDYLNNLSDFSLGFQEYQLSNQFQSYIPNSFANTQIYLLIQVIDQSGSKANIFDKFDFQNLPISCDDNKLNSYEMNLKISLMFSALNNASDQACLAFAKLIYHNLTLSSLQQESISFLQAIKVYRKQLKILNLQQEQQHRILEDQNSQGCLNVKSLLFYSSKLIQQLPPLEEALLKEFKVNINLIEKLFDKLMSQKQGLEETLSQNLNVWNEETMDKFKTRISYFLSIFHFIDEQVSILTIYTKEDDELYQTTIKCQEILLNLIQQIEKEILIDEKICQLSGDFINMKLQKQTPLNFLNQLQMKFSEEDTFIKYYLKRQINFTFNPQMFSIQEKDKIISLVNSSNLMIGESNYVIQNLYMLTEFSRFVQLDQISQIQTQVGQLQICKDQIQKQQFNYSIYCIQLLKNGTYAKCQAIFIQNTFNPNLVDVNCNCEQIGDLFLGYLLNNNLPQVEPKADSNNLHDILKIDLTNTQLLIQLIFLGLVLVIYVILHQLDKIIIKNLQSEGSEAADSLQRNTQKFFLHPSYFIIIRQNYQYLHNILGLFFYQADLITRSFNFTGLALQIQLTYMLSILLIQDLSDPFLILRIIILILTNLFYRLLLKVCKGIFRLNKTLRNLQTISLFGLMIMHSIITIFLAKNFNRQIEAIIYSTSIFLLMELIFEPVLIFARIYIYLIAIPQIKDLQFDKTILMMYYFSWHWKLEQTLKHCIVV